MAKKVTGAAEKPHWHLVRFHSGIENTPSSDGHRPPKKCEAEGLM